MCYSTITAILILIKFAAASYYMSLSTRSIRLRRCIQATAVFTVIGALIWRFEIVDSIIVTVAFCSVFLGVWAGFQAGMRMQTEKVQKLLTKSQRLEVDGLQLRQRLSHLEAELEAYGVVRDMDASPYRGSQPEGYSITEFPSLGYYRDFANGKMTAEEFSALSAEDLQPRIVESSVRPPKKITR